MERVEKNPGCKKCKHYRYYETVLYGIPISKCFAHKIEKYSVEDGTYFKLDNCAVHNVAGECAKFERRSFLRRLTIWSA